MILFDSHCHLDDRSYKNDMNDVLNRAGHAGVKAIMLVGITEKNAPGLVALAKSNPIFCASVGIHPHDASSCSEQAIKNLKELAKNSVVKAWGETGLDFARMYSPRAVQEKWFLRQMETAKELDLPLILHERESGGRFLDMLKSYHNNGPINGVVHCFSGNQNELNHYLDLGLHIGITGILTIKTRGEELRKLVTHIPENRLLVETDAPYLTPAPEKNKTRRNEPAFVKSTLMKLAEVRGDDPMRLSKIIWENTCRLYGTDPAA